MAEQKIPDELLGVIATTADGRDITRPFTRGLEEPRDARLLGSTDWGAYDRIRKDDQVKSTMEQRIAAVVSRDWDVLPGDDEDPRAIEAADAFKLVLERASIDAVQRKMLWGVFYGYQVAELIWVPGRERIDFQLRVRHARRFRFTGDGQLRLVTLGKPQGEIVPERKFWVARHGATDDDSWYGEGLADWLYWPVLFKRNGLRFWNKFLDKFAIPTALGKYRPGTPREQIADLLAALRAIANDTGIAIPEGAAIELLNVANAGPDFEKMPAMMDAAITKIVLSQVGTTENGKYAGTANTHDSVKLEVIKADADEQSDSFNAGPARWWTDLNYGPDVPAPRFIRVVEEEQDLKVQAETDVTLAKLGWRRNEDSFRDTYGDGYDFTPPADPTRDQVAGAGKTIDDEQDPDADAGKVVPFRKAAASFAEGEGDIVDAIAAQLVDQGLTPLGPMIMPIVAAIEAANSPGELEAGLIRSLDQAQVDQLVEQLGRAGFALRIAAEGGAESSRG